MFVWHATEKIKIRGRPVPRTPTHLKPQKLTPANFPCPFLSPFLRRDHVVRMRLMTLGVGDGYSGGYQGALAPGSPSRRDKWNSLRFGGGPGPRTQPMSNLAPGKRPAVTASTVGPAPAEVPATAVAKVELVSSGGDWRRTFRRPTDSGKTFQLGVAQSLPAPLPPPRRCPYAGVRRDGGRGRRRRCAGCPTTATPERHAALPTLTLAPPARPVRAREGPAALDHLSLPELGTACRQTGTREARLHGPIGSFPARRGPAERWTGLGHCPRDRCFRRLPAVRVERPLRPAP